MTKMQLDPKKYIYVGSCESKMKKNTYRRILARRNQAAISMIEIQNLKFHNLAIAEQ